MWHCKTYVEARPYIRMTPILTLRGGDLKELLSLLDVPRDVLVTVLSRNGKVTFVCPSDPVVKVCLLPVSGRYDVIESYEVTVEREVCCAEGLGCEESVVSTGHCMELNVREWILVEDDHLIVNATPSLIRRVVEDMFIENGVLKQRDGMPFISINENGSFLTFGEKRGTMKIYPALLREDINHQLNKPEIEIFADRSIRIGEREFFAREEEFGRTWRVRIPILREMLAETIQVGWAYVSMRWIGNVLNLYVGLRRLHENEFVAEFKTEIELKDGELYVDCPRNCILARCPVIKLDSIVFALPSLSK